MPYDVSIKITSESDNTGATTAAQAVDRLAKSATQANQQMSASTQQNAQKAQQAYDLMRGVLDGVNQEIAKFVKAHPEVTRAHDGIQKSTAQTSQATGALRGAVSALTTQLGTLGGPVGSAVSNVLLQMQQGLAAVTVAGAAATAGIAALAGSLRNASEERKQFAELSASSDIAGFRKEIESLTQAAETNNSAWVKLFPNVTKVLAALGLIDHNLVLSQSALAEKTQAYADALERIKADKVREVTRALDQQRAVLQAGDNSIAKIAVEGQNAIDDMIRSLSKLGVGGPELQAVINKLKEVNALRVGNEQTAIANSAAEAQAARAKQRAEAEAGAMRAMLQSEQALQLQIVALTQGEEAATRQKIAIEADTLATKVGAEAADAWKQRQLDLSQSIFATNRAIDQQAKYSAELAKQWALEKQVMESLKQEQEAAFSQRGRVSDLDAQILRAAGAPEALLLQQRIAALQQQLRDRQSNPLLQNDNEIEALQKNIQLAQVELYKLQNTSIDIAGEIGRVVTDITGAVINGTLKWADIGKSILASFVRVGLETFTNFLRQMSQQQQFAQVAAAGGIAMPGGGGGGGGGILQSIIGMFSGGGGRPPGVSGPLLPNGSFLSGGGGFLGMGSLGGIADMGLQGAGLFGGMMGGGSLGIGGQILSTLASSAMTSGISLGLGGSGGLMGGLITTMAGSASVPVVGWIVAAIAAVVLAITQIFGAQKPNPTVNVRSQLEGFSYDAIQNLFQSGRVKTSATGKDIPNSAVVDTKNQVQEILETYSKQWTDILNLFPVIVHDKMIPRLEYANRVLNQVFGKMKFTEGGGRTIQEEIRDLGALWAPGGFYAASRGIFGAGIAESLNLAGLGGLSAQALTTFGEAPDNLSFMNVFKLPGLNAPKKPKDMEPFTKALAEFVGLTSGLASVSGSGVTPFLTEQDMARLQGRIGEVLKITDGSKFAPAVDKLKAQIQPITDFLEKALQQTTQLFGRGLVAALDAASESSALMAFQRNLGAGVKDMIFSGITEAFIASAQFNDLLAPIQKTIREFTQQAIDSGTAPDIDAFRRAILPNIEDISARADALAPLIAELQALGFDIKDAIGNAFGGGTSAGRIEINFNGNVTIDSEERMNEFERRLAALLRGSLPPA